MPSLRLSRITDNFSAILVFPQMLPRGLHTPQGISLSRRGRRSKGKDGIEDTGDGRPCHLRSIRLRSGQVFDFFPFGRQGQAVAICAFSRQRIVSRLSQRALCSAARCFDSAQHDKRRWGKPPPCESAFILRCCSEPALNGVEGTGLAGRTSIQHRESRNNYQAARWTDCSRRMLIVSLAIPVNRPHKTVALSLS